MLSALEPDEIERLQDYLGRCLVALGDSPPAAALEPARDKPRTADAAGRR
jgi:hypothetical protein